MSINDVDVLYDQMPEVFDPKKVSDSWEEDYFFVRIDNIDQFESIENALSDDFIKDRENTLLDDANKAYPEEMKTHIDGHDLDLGVFPGSPNQTRSGEYFPPDALAFYLPIRYFYPHWWGIYLFHEGVDYLTNLLIKLSRNKIDEQIAKRAAILFLYYHEAFHHAVESFATRLEITHRKPLYKTGFQRLFENAYRKGECWEDSLASAHAFRRLKKNYRKIFGKKWPKLEVAFMEYLNRSGPDNRRALDILDDKSFNLRRARFAEDNQTESLPVIPTKPGDLWFLFGHGFHGIGNIRSRTNYMIHKDSTLSRRLNLKSRLLNYRQLLKKLKKLCPGLKKKREAKGSHVVYTWKGNESQIPRHPGDLRKSTIIKILRQLGIQKSWSDFLAS